MKVLTVALRLMLVIATRQARRAAERRYRDGLTYPKAVP
jgi:hypothetical protein